MHDSIQREHQSILINEDKSFISVCSMSFFSFRQSFSESQGYRSGIEIRSAHMSSCKLTYFNSQSLAEAIRFLLNYGKIEFEDIRIDFIKDWPTYPKETLPLGQLPILEIDGKVFSQTIAICRYLAKRVGLAGNTVLEDYEIDNAVDTANDFRASELCIV